MTRSDLLNIYNYCGHSVAVTAIEDEELTTPGEKDDLFEELERIHKEALRLATPPLTLTDLRNLFDESGYDIALAVLEDAKLPLDEEQRFQEALMSWQMQQMVRWTRPGRYPAAFNPHEF
jgi:hypothetical protein